MCSSDLLTTLLESRAQRDQAAEAARKAAADRGQLESFRGQLVAEYDRTDASWRAAADAVKAHRRGRPGLFSGRGVRRAWKSDHERFTAALRRAAIPRDAGQRSLTTVTGQIAWYRVAEEEALTDYSRADTAVRDVEPAAAGARARWGDRVPDGPQYGAAQDAETENQDLIGKRELSAPWADEEFSRARTELFLAALTLHKAFILGAAGQAWRNLRALMDILDGKGRPRDPAATRAAWQTLFLVVPVVSSTFASFGRLFAGLGRESLGWLLVDEAGQAEIGRASCRERV